MDDDLTPRAGAALRPRPAGDRALGVGTARRARSLALHRRRPARPAALRRSPRWCWPATPLGDLVFWPRLTADRGGPAVRTPLQRAALAWADDRRGPGRRARCASGCAARRWRSTPGAVLVVFSRRALGADPAAVRDLLARPATADGCRGRAASERRRAPIAATTDEHDRHEHRRQPGDLGAVGQPVAHRRQPGDRERGQAADDEAADVPELRDARRPRT